MKCEHMNFAVHADVGRLTESDTSAVVVAYTMAVHVKCTECQQEFEFIGLPMGYSPHEPRCSVNGTEARMPIKPVGEVMAMDLPSFGVRRVV